MGGKPTIQCFDAHLTDHIFMASHLDLEEQEQLDQLKHFWKQYGNAITWLLIAVLGAYAAWNGYNYWQRRQASQVAVLFDELERAVQAGETSRVERVFADMKDKFPKTVFAQQGAMLAARHFDDKSKPDQAQAALRWVAQNSADKGYQALAKLRLAGLLIDAKDYSGAAGMLAGDFPAGFEALAADRRGDLAMVQSKPQQARADYEKAYRLLDSTSPYRRMIEVKLNALGVDAQKIVAGAPPA